MKSVYVCMILIVAFVSNLSPQWKPVNYFTENVWLNSVYFTDDNNGWIAGSQGTILKYDPLLMSWYKLNSGTDENINDIGFFDNNFGIAAGDNGLLLISSDGGNSWVNINLGITSNFNELNLLPPATASIAGDNGEFYRTINMGSDWEKVNIPTDKNLKSVFFVSETKGFAGAESASLFHTEDGGINWVEKNFSSPLMAEIPDIDAIFFVDSLTGYFGGGYPQVLVIFQKTTDGGITWVSENLAGSGMIRDLSFRDADNGVIVGGSNTWDRFLAVKNGFSYETQIYHNEDYDIMSCFITPSGKGWAVGGGGAIFYAEDFMGKWGQLYLGSEDQPLALSASSDNNFYIESARNNFRDPASVTIKGFHENKLFMDVSRYWNQSGVEYLTDLQMIDSLYGFKYPSLQSTTDGGYTWDYLNTPAYEARIFFISGTTGWLYGENIYKTVDGGGNWTLQYEPDFLISELTFINENTGYAVGSDDNLQGKIIKTTDGGISWTVLQTPKSNHLTSVAFSNENTGIATGWGSTILFTDTGGDNWRKLNSRKVHFKIQEIKKAVQYSSDKRVKIVKNESGFGYYAITVRSEDNYLDAEFKGDVIYIASDQGMILKSYNLGRGWVKEYFEEPVLEVKIDGMDFALARTPSNVYIQKRSEAAYSPAALLSLNARMESGTSILEWTTTDESESSSFRIERKAGNNWDEISVVNVRIKEENNPYIYADKKLPASGEVRYRILQINKSGESVYSDEVALTPELNTFVLQQNYPNPFNPVTRIEYTIPVREFVEIKVTDALGREVTKLENSQKDPGVYQVTFNSADHNLSSGVYFYTVRAGSFTSTRKMILLK
jgi:photosystem II stability/assembly factor-like uncharacterized protein